MLRPAPQCDSALTPNFREILEELKGGLVSLLGNRLLRIVLFGSMARGDDNDQSDMDIAMVIRDLTRDLKHQTLEKVSEIKAEISHACVCLCRFGG